MGTEELNFEKTLLRAKDAVNYFYSFRLDELKKEDAIHIKSLIDYIEYLEYLE